ncbi:MAG: RHS repeat-associated core domain-containing protein [Chthoniobacterales bacterium]
MADGGKVCFRREAWYTESGAGPNYTTRATKIIDPYGQESDLSFTIYGALDRVTEPAGRYLQINYVSVPGQGFKCIGSVDANDGRGNITQSVSYTYVQASSFNQLTRVDYSDSTSATYTYQTDRLLATADDVRHPGPMKKILYEYMPNGTLGQIKSEKNLTTGQVVSQIAYPSDTVRVETRGDGPSRTFTYDGQARLTSYTDFYTATSQPHTSYIFYDGNGYRWAFQNARGYTTYTVREGNIGALITLTHPDTTYQGYGYTDYDNPYYVNIREDERRHNTYFSRDEHNRVSKIWYPDWDPNHPDDSPAESVTYNDFGQVLTHTMTSGGVETLVYDTRGLLQTYTPPATESDPNPGAHPVQYFYYTSGAQTDRLLRVVDAKGNSNWFEYNARGQTTKVTHQDGTYIQADYNSDGTLAWVADENHPGAAYDENQRTRYVYDEYKRVVSVTNPSNQTTNIDYALDWVNPLVHTTTNPHYILSPNNKNVFFDYDPNFRKKDQAAAFSSADEAWTLFEYDEVGNLAKVTDPRSNATTFEYDTRNRRKTMTDPAPFNNQITQWEYDEVGNLKKEIRPDQLFRRWEYDSTNRVIDTYGFSNEHTHYQRDKAGNIIQLVDPKQPPSTYFFSFDAMNRKTAATYPLDATGANRTESWHYDVVGSLALYKNPADQYRHLDFPDSYDPRNRLRHAGWNLSSTTPSADSTIGQEITVGFDDASRLTSITTNNGETMLAFGYDDANRKIWEDQTVTGHPTHRVQTTPDADGNRNALSVVTNGQTNYAISYDYTGRNQLKTIYDGNSTPWFTYTYDPAGNMTKRQAVYGGVNDSVNLIDGNGQNQYDALNRPMMWENTGAGDAWFARSWYSYDSLSRQTGTWRDEQGGKGDAFGYDVNGQLTGVNYNADGVNVGAPVNATRLVSYAMTPDTLNRASMNDNGDVTDYAPNALNQYQTAGGADIYYDDKFNLMWTGGFSAGYDAANHLIAIGSGEDYGQFTYDGLGRCVKRNVNWETQIITYDGWNPIVEWDEWDNLSAWNVYGGSADEILWRYSDRSGHLRYHTDRQGNVIALLDYNGNGIERYTYDAFGHPTVTDWNGITQRDFSWYWNRFMFRGREYFPELGLYDMRARFYYPALGRFLQRDPIGFAGGDANLFRYCNHNPVNGSDPSGLEDPEVSRVWVIDKPLPGPVSGIRFTDLNEALNGGGDASTGSDERSYPHTFGDGQRSVPPITPWRLPDEDDDEDTQPGASLEAFGNNVAGVQAAGGSSSQIGGLLAGTGTYTGAIDQLHGGSGFWLSRNSWSFNANSWGGNGATGPRARAMGISRVARGFGKGIFGLQIYLSARSIRDNPTGENITHESFNLGMGAVGLFTGPIGFGVSTVYTVVDVSVGWDNVFHYMNESGSAEYWYHNPSPF